MFRRNTYVRTSQAWYADTALDGCAERVCISTPAPGEFHVEWRQLGDKLVPELRAFADSWPSLKSWTGQLVERMAALDGAAISPDDFCKMLDELGYSDETERVRPAVSERA